jgi:hypothetical protein
MLRKTKLKIATLAVLIGLALPVAADARGFDSGAGVGHFRAGAHFNHPLWNHFGFHRHHFLRAGFGYAGLWGGNRACYSNFGWPRWNVGYFGNPFFHRRHRFGYWGGANLCSPYWGSPIWSAGWGGPFWGTGWNNPFWGGGFANPLWGGIGLNFPLWSNAWDPLF